MKTVIKIPTNNNHMIRKLCESLKYYKTQSLLLSHEIENIFQIYLISGLINISS